MAQENILLDKLRLAHLIPPDQFKLTVQSLQDAIRALQHSSRRLANQLTLSGTKTELIAQLTDEILGI